jgi:hypothetical protein
MLGLVSTAHKPVVAKTPAVAKDRPAVKVRKAPLLWRMKQRLQLLRNGSLFVPAYAWVARNLFGLGVIVGECRMRVVHNDGSVTEYGLMSRKVITTAGVNYLAADMGGGSNHIAAFKFHGYGTGTTAESTGDTTLVTEFTTQYATDNVRPTGSQSATNNVYTTVATFSPDSGGTLAVTECGLFTQAATGGGTLWDRFKFAAVNLVAGSDSLQSTITATFPAGG